MRSRLRRAVIGAAGLGIATATTIALAWPSHAATQPATAAAARVVPVSSISALRTAIGNAKAGDRIELADGSYSVSSSINIARSSITVAAQHVGKAKLTGGATFTFGTVTAVGIEGFSFAGSAGLGVPTSADHVKISRNTFQLSSSGAWLSVAGDDAEVDHNTFQHRTSEGVFLQLTGPGAHDMAKHTWIHHNYFFDHQFSGSNGGESIRLGLSGRQHGSAQAIVEYNLFEKADGDSEAISVKSSDNLIRYNTLRNSKGSIVLRHGNRNRVEGNIELGGTSGIRFYGNDHVIVNNVVQNSGGQAVEVGGGEIKDDTDNTTAHEAADRCLVAFNTLVKDRAAPIKVGGGKEFAPDHITFANNIVVGTSGSAATVSQGTNLTWSGNIISGVSRGSIPSSGATSVNPKLTTDAGGVYRLSSGSPAIDASVGTYPQITLDLDLQARSGKFDVGADEFKSGGTVRLPLTTADVGPNAA